MSRGFHGDICGDPDESEFQKRQRREGVRPGEKSQMTCNQCGTSISEGSFCSRCKQL